MTPTPNRLLPRAAATLLVAVFGWGALSRPSGAAAPPSEAAGVAAFETVRTVLQHPRCQNCHIPGDAPLQSDAGRVHGLSVVRGKDGRGAPGLACATCHAATNPPGSYGPHVPPGAPGWRLPPPEQKMVFIGLTSGELCRRLKDPRSNGGRTLEALVHHVDTDGLVLWGWSPGEGRAPVGVSHEDFVARFREWVAAGAPCAP
jgi:hypothetical protein